MENLPQRLLIVDDEPDLCEILRFNLETEGYLITTVHSAEEALQTPLNTFSLILLDVMMGGMSGFALAKKLKENPETAHVPIIFLTAKDTENDMITGFNIGADDYISKPFSIREVSVRVRAVLRRSVGSGIALLSNANFHAEGIVINEEKKTVYIDGEEIVFTRTEYELFTLLYRSGGRVFSRQELIDKVWPKDVLVSDRTVDVNITRLRKKIGRFANCIATRQGFGYYYEEV